MLLFEGDLDPSKIRVHAPSAVVLLCGGPSLGVGGDAPLSLRDAFLKINDNPAIRKHNVILPEDITREFGISSPYRDFLEFETDLAQITELILLFCESEGSFAELGAFSVITEIAEHILVIVLDNNWDDKSFIRLGPLQHLHNKHGNSAIYVLHRADISLNKDPSTIDKDALKNLLQKPITDRLAATRDHTSFLATSHGHIIKLIVGLIQEYGALKFDEITSLLGKLNITPTQAELEKYLYCAQTVDWIIKSRRGHEDYFIALPDRNDAASQFFKDTISEKDKTRRRTLIREHWEKTDPARHKGICEINAGGKK